MTRPPLPDPRRLLTHEVFLRELAARLVSDPAGADDVVQETWVAAIERAPPEARSLRAWLAQVARNAARMAWRTEARRRRRERLVARAEAVPSPELVRERERAREAVVQAVLRLEDPYRDVVLLRFYEGLAPRDAARRLGLPVETVRTRTRRAIERLRADLDRRAGDRHAKTLVLAPLAAGPTNTGAAALWGGTIVMGAKARLGAVALLLLAAGGAALLGAGLGLLDGASPEAPGAVAAGDAQQIAPKAEEPTLAGLPPEGAPGTPPRKPEGADVNRRFRSRGVLRGFVLSGRTHTPVAGAQVQAEMTRGAVPDGMHLAIHAGEAGWTETDEAGRFEIRDLPVGAYAVSVRHDHEGVAYEEGVAAADPPWMRLYPMPADESARTLGVRVLDAQGEPVPGAEVVCSTAIGESPAAARTNAQGLVHFVDLPVVAETIQGWVTASSETGMGRAAFDLAPRWRRGPQPPIEVVLEPPGSLEGRLVPRGADLPGGARVLAWSLRGGRGGWARGACHAAPADGRGAFRFERLPAGSFVLLVEGVGDLRMDLGERTAEGPGEWAHLEVEVRSGRVTQVDVPLVPGGAIRGRVLADGRAVPDCRVEVHLPQGPGGLEERMKRRGVPLWRLDSEWPDSRRFPLAFRVLRTDATGRYEARGLLPGPYRVRVLPPEALSFDLREPVDVRDGQTTELEHHLDAAGTLEVAARPFDSLGVRRVGAEVFHATLITPRGSLGALSVPGLAVGSWEVYRVHSDETIPPARLAGFEIRAGRITYLDLSDVGNVRARLRVLEAGRPVVGAQVQLPGLGYSVLLTDEAGRVSWATSDFGRPQEAHAQVSASPSHAPLGVRFPFAGAEVDFEIPSGALEVVARNAQGQTVPGATVILMQPQGPPARTVVVGEARVALAAGEQRRTTNAWGVARWKGLPPGPYAIEVRLPQAGGMARANAMVEEASTRIDVEVATGGTLRLRVLGTDGRPRAGVRVGLALLPSGEEDWKRALQLTQNGWQTDAAGLFVAPGVPAGTARANVWVLPPGAWSASENARGDVRIDAGETAELELRLQAVPAPR